VRQLNDLEMMLLSNNQLSSLPSGLERLKKLKTIVLSNNPVSSEELQRLRQQYPDINIIF